MKRDPTVLQAVPSEPRPAEVCADGALTVPLAADFTGLSRRTLYQLIDDGRLHRIRVGRRVLIARRELVELLAAGLEGGSEKP